LPGVHIYPQSNSNITKHQHRKFVFIFVPKFHSGAQPIRI
jgi:hypothetical protein